MKWDIKNRSRLSIVVSGIVILIGVVVMLSWKIDFRPALRILPEAPTMKFNTALLMVFSAIAVLTLHRKSVIANRLNQILVLIVLIVGFATALSHFLNLDFGLDNLFLEDSISAFRPGRMSVATSIGFILIGLAIIGTKSNKERIYKAFKVLPTLVIFIAILVVITYILQFNSDSKVLIFKSMALHTALMFILLALAISLTDSNFNYVGFLSGNYSGSKLARILLPFAIILPLILSILLLYSLNENRVSSDLNIALYTLAYAVIGFIYISFISYRINNADERRSMLEKALNDANQELWQYKHALDESSIVAILDENRLVKKVNDKFCQLTKYDRPEIIGRTMRFLSAGFQDSDFFENMWSELNKGNVWMGGIKNISKDGHYFWVHAVTIPFKNKEGKIYQYLTLQQDVTQYYYLTAQYDNLVLRNKEIEQFTYIASHDLQEPLRTLKSISEILLMEYSDKLDIDGVKGLVYISEAVDRMSNLVRDLLDYSRLGIRRELGTVDTSEVLNALKQDLKVAISEANAEIIEKNSIELKAYTVEFRLLLQNLIGNAIKFSRADVPPVVEFDINEEPERFLFSVKDNGTGIAEASSRTIFAIFKTAHPTGSYKGTGIGLAHCDKIVQLHGGEIWYTSELNKGSTFYFTIPKL